jgi:hypothetical protein
MGGTTYSFQQTDGNMGTPSDGAPSQTGQTANVTSQPAQPGNISSGGGKGMSMPMFGGDSQYFGFNPDGSVIGHATGSYQQTPLPPAQTSLQQTSTTNPVLQGPGDLTGQIGMPAGPGYMQPAPLPSAKPATPTNPLPPGTGYMPGLITKIPGMPTNPVLQGPGDLTGQIGMPAGPGYMQPAPKVVATPQATPLNPLGTIGLPYGPGYTAPTMKPVLKSPAVPVPQTPQQIAQQVGIRANPVQPRTTARPIYRPKAY